MIRTSSRPFVVVDSGEGRIQGIFSHPSVSFTQAAAGVTGEGHLQTTPDGLTIVGQQSPTNWISVLGLLGFVATCALQGVLLKYGKRSSYTLSGLITFGPMFLGVALAKKIATAKPLTATIPWKKIKKPELRGSELLFLSRQKPKGMIYFTSSDSRALHTLVDVLRTESAIGNEGAPNAYPTSTVASSCAGNRPGENLGYEVTENEA